MLRLKERPSVFKSESARLKRISRYALDSDCYQKHAAACVKGGRILSVGINKNTAPGRQWLDGVPCSEHAEVAALRQIKDTRGVTLYVSRVRKDGSSGYSRPCANCQKYIAESGIKKVVYTDDNTFAANEDLAFTRNYNSLNEDAYAARKGVINVGNVR